MRLSYGEVASRGPKTYGVHVTFSSGRFRSKSQTRTIRPGKGKQNCQEASIQNMSRELHHLGPFVRLSARPKLIDSANESIYLAKGARHPKNGTTLVRVVCCQEIVDLLVKTPCLLHFEGR